MEKKTPLYDIHVKYKGKIVPFAGYLLPVQYEGVIAEHKAVRRGRYNMDFDLAGDDPYGNRQKAYRHIDALKQREGGQP